MDCLVFQWDSNQRALQINTSKYKPLHHHVHCTCNGVLIEAWYSQQWACIEVTWHCIQARVILNSPPTTRTSTTRTMTEITEIRMHQSCVGVCVPVCGCHSVWVCVCVTVCVCVSQCVWVGVCVRALITFQPVRCFFFFNLVEVLSKWVAAARTLSVLENVKK